jgi:hypothetical protein
MWSGEAEWCLDVLNLFDLCFVQPALIAAKRAALIEAGRSRQASMK